MTADSAAATLLHSAAGTAARTDDGSPVEQQRDDTVVHAIVLLGVARDRRECDPAGGSSSSGSCSGHISV